MAASSINEVTSLSIKAEDLYRKSHYERSVTKWRSALAAAEALGEEDSVLVALFKTEVVRVSLFCETVRVGRLSQTFVLEMLELLAASAAILRRRRDAGTLLGGKCRAIETKWFYTFAANGEQPLGEVHIALLRILAKLVGFEAFIGVCYNCMTLLREAMVCGSLERGGQAERTFLSFLCDLCDEAVALMVLPRVDDGKAIGTPMELSVLARWPQVLGDLAAPEHRAWHDRLSRGLMRLRQSGVVEKRGMVSDKADRLRAHEGKERARADQERAAAAASGQLKSCALSGCGATEAHVSQFGKCGSCKAAVYCCRDHQLADWPAHKAACKAARKAAAAAKDAA